VFATVDCRKSYRIKIKSEVDDGDERGEAPPCNARCIGQGSSAVAAGGEQPSDGQRRATCVQQKRARAREVY